MTIELKDLPSRWAELESLLRSGSEVTLTNGGTAVGKVVPQATPRATPQFDLHPGAFQPAPDFDDPLPEEFWTGGTP